MTRFLRARFPALLLPALLLASAASIHAEDETPPHTVAEPVPDADAPAEDLTADLPPDDAADENAAAGAIAETVDMISDLPGARKEQKPELMETLEPSGPLLETPSRCYNILASIKVEIDSISKDLDNGGKEITRLTTTSDKLCKHINELADLWPDNARFRDVCGSAKRQALILHDELGRVPRKWTHVRWSFNGAVKDIRRVRLIARDLAEAEPKPIEVVGRDGKVTLIEPEAPPVDPLIAERDRKIKEVEDAKAKLKAAEEARKDRRMPVSLDDAKQ